MRGLRTTAVKELAYGLRVAELSYDPGPIGLCSLYS